VPIAFWLFMAIIANMNRGGSKPGERRGGRKKGSLNKATIERALMAEREVANANETRQKLAKDHLEELVNFYARMAISKPDEVEKWSKLRMQAALHLNYIGFLSHRTRLVRLHIRKTGSPLRYHLLIPARKPLAVHWARARQVHHQRSPLTEEEWARERATVISR
jgi:hypothetical protein